MLLSGGGSAGYVVALRSPIRNTVYINSRIHQGLCNLPSQVSCSPMYTKKNEAIRTQGHYYLRT